MNMNEGTYFLSRIGWKIEDKDCEKRDSHAWDDEIHSVKKRFSPHRDVERNV